MPTENKVQKNDLTLYSKANTKDLVIQNLKDELLIYNLQTNKASCLNQTAALVWESCDGKSSISEIAEKLNKKFKGGVVHEDLVMFAIMELKGNGLIENGEKELEHMEFEGLSRREIVRKVGFASLVALPIVSSIVAPKASFAQTPPCPAGTLAPGTVKGTCVTAVDSRDCTRNCVLGRFDEEFSPGVDCCRAAAAGDIGNGVINDIDRCEVGPDGLTRCNCVCSN